MSDTTPFGILEYGHLISNIIPSSRIPSGEAPHHGAPMHIHCASVLVMTAILSMVPPRRAGGAPSVFTPPPSTPHPPHPTPQRPGRIIAYIGVRSGSQRCPRKNIRPFYGEFSLLDLKIRVLQQLGLEIMVSSDSPEMLAIAASYAGVETVARKPYFARSDISTAQYFRHIAEEVGDRAEHILYAPVTAPFLTVAHFKRLLAVFQNAAAPRRRRADRPGFARSGDSLSLGVIVGATDEGSMPAESAAFVVSHQGHFWYDRAPLNFDPALAMPTQDAPVLLEVAYSAAVVTRRALYDARTVLGHTSGSKSPVFVELDSMNGFEINDCDDFKLAQLLYTRRHGPPPLLSVPVADEAPFVDVQISEHGTDRRFTVPNLLDSTATAASAEYFCISNGASGNTDVAQCVTQVVGVLVPRSPLMALEGRILVALHVEDQGGTGAGKPSMDGTHDERLPLPSVAEISGRVSALLAPELQALHPSTGSAPPQYTYASPTRFLTTIASVAAGVAVRTCGMHGLPPRGVFCDAVAANIREDMRNILVTELLRQLAERTGASNSATTARGQLDGDLFVDTSSEVGVLTNTALLADTAWTTFFDHAARQHRSRGVSVSMDESGSRRGNVYSATWFPAEDLLGCADDRWGCHKCSRCFHMVVPHSNAGTEADAWRVPDTKNVNNDGSEDDPSSLTMLLSAVRHCRDVVLRKGANYGLLGLRRENRWMQFIDGKSHFKGEFAYERELLLPAWFFSHHGANGTDDLWVGNSSYLGLWHNAVSHEGCGNPVRVGAKQSTREYLLSARTFAGVPHALSMLEVTLSIVGLQQCVDVRTHPFFFSMFCPTSRHQYHAVRQNAVDVQHAAFRNTRWAVLDLATWRHRGPI